MKPPGAGLLALAGLTIKEALRQRLWLLLLGAIALVLVAVPNLQAVDDAARLKLAVAMVTGVIGFVTILLAALVGAATVRRDLDQRIGFLLFAKPLSRFSFLAGRWLGLVAATLLAILALALVGAVAVQLQLGRQPTMRATLEPVEWKMVDRLGKVAALPDERERLSLTGPPGNGVEYRFADLPEPVGDAYEVLIRTRVRGNRMGTEVTHFRTSVSALADDGSPVFLAVHPESPYGTEVGGGAVRRKGEVVLRDRNRKQRDLAQDYLRLVLPAEAVGDDRAVTVRVLRRQKQGVVGFERDAGCLVAVSGGPFAYNLVKAGLLILAKVALLCAVALFCATMANIGVSLFATLTCYFAGNTLRILDETLRWEDLGRALERFLTAIFKLAPDFQRFGIDSHLAASRGVGWGMVGEGWLYYGAYTAVFLIAGWLVMLRREL